MANVFLSASIPLPMRDRRFFESTDVLLVREAVKSLVETVLPLGTITCGGHPAITPLLALFARSAEIDRDRLVIYQSQHYESIFPLENTDFHNLVVVDAAGDDAEANLHSMREQMIASREFDAAVFIGGMEGVLVEAEAFASAHPTAVLLPVASTGGAALELYRRGEFPADLVTDLTYSSLFRRHLGSLEPRAMDR